MYEVIFENLFAKQMRYPCYNINPRIYFDIYTRSFYLPVLKLKCIPGRNVYSVGIGFELLDLGCILSGEVDQILDE